MAILEIPQLEEEIDKDGQVVSQSDARPQPSMPLSDTSKTAEATIAIPGDEVQAIVLGKQISELPADLYIPPDALRIFLEAFEGPLDLLLYLIKKQNLDIVDMPVAEITRQYMTYVDMMKKLQVTLAAEYMVMAAMLAEIKSRLLLPKPEKLVDGEMVDPRVELIRRLREYEVFKQAAAQIDELPRMERDTFAVKAEVPKVEKSLILAEVSLDELLNAFKKVMIQSQLHSHHQVEREPLSIRERMSIILDLVQQNEYCEFTHMFNSAEGRMGVVVSLLAILELRREALIDIVQNEAFSQIYIKKHKG